MSLWRGQPLGGLADPDAIHIEAQRLEEMYEQTLEDRAEALLGIGEHHAAVAELEALVRNGPLRERRSRLLMIALYRCGRQGDALRAFEDLRRLLDDELGLRPSTDLQTTQQAILAHDVSLDPPAPAVPASTTAPSPSNELPWWLGSALSTPIHGRESLLDEILGTVNRVAGRSSDGYPIHTLLLAGDAGVGKTRLLAEVASGIGEADIRVLAGWCDPEGVVPFRPLMEALRKVAREGPVGQPALLRTAAFIDQYLADGLGGAQRTDPETDRLRFFEAMANLLRHAAAERPLFLAIDDIHWLDPASAALLRYLLRQPAPQPIVVVACYRKDPTEHTSAWTRCLDELRRHRECSIIEVTEVGQDASIRIVKDVTAEIGSGDAAALAERVLPFTGGNPLFLREVVAQLALAGGPETGANSVPVPPTMLAAVTERVRALDSTAQEVVNAAAVLGRQFSLADLSAVTSCTTDTVLTAVDSARMVLLVDEVPDLLDHFAFRHALLREAVHDLMPRSRRARLHIAAGAAYASRDDVKSLLARAFHLIEAVPVCPVEEAARAAVDAADMALNRLAFEEAIHVLDRALQLASPESAISAPTRFDLFTRLGRVRAYRGEDSLRDEAFAAAAGVARAANDPVGLAVAALGEDLDTRALTPSRDRLDLLTEALEGLNRVASPLRVAVASTYVALASLSSGATGVRGLADATVQLARQLDDPAALSKALLAWTTCTNTSVQPVERLSVITEALDLAETAGLSSTIARARLSRVGALVRLGRVAAADEEFHRYRDLADSTRVPRLLWHADVVAAALGRLHGRFDEAQGFAERALATGQRFAIAEAPMGFGVHTFFTHLHQARLAELRPALEAFASARPDLRLWTLSSAVAARACGDVSAASHALDAFVDRLPSLDPDGEFWSDELLVAGQLASDLGADRTVADALWMGLSRCRGQFEVFGATAGTFGPVDRVLGLLAVLRNEQEEARSLFSRAFELCREMDARSWMVWTGLDLASEQAAAGARGEAQRTMDIVAPIAKELGMTSLQPGDGWR